MTSPERNSAYDAAHCREVWKRVAPAEDPYPVTGAESGTQSGELSLPGAQADPCCMGSGAAGSVEVLQGFLREELGDAQVYAYLASRVPREMARTLHAMGEDEKRHARDLAAAPGDLIELLPIDLERRIHRRHLQNIPAKLRQRRLQLRAGDAPVTAAEHRAGRVLRVGREAEAQARLLALTVIFGERHRARRAAGKHDQKAGRHRVERAGMAHAPLAEHAAELGHNVVARPVRGLIDQQDPVHAGHTWSMAARIFSTAVSVPQSSVQPEAILWPPPP